MRKDVKVAIGDPAELRRANLARLVATRGFVRVIDAGEYFEVSDVTIRADLSALERDGLLVRVHGGAMPSTVMSQHESSIEASRDRASAAKRAIGDAGAALITSGESLYIDAGSTALALATALANRHELTDVTVVTSSLS